MTDENVAIRMETTPGGVEVAVRIRMQGDEGEMLVCHDYCAQAGFMGAGNCQRRRFHRSEAAAYRLGPEGFLAEMQDRLMAQMDRYGR